MISIQNSLTQSKLFLKLLRLHKIAELSPRETSRSSKPCAPKEMAGSVAAATIGASRIPGFPRNTRRGHRKLMAKWRNRTSQNFTCLKWRFRHCLMGCVAKRSAIVPRSPSSTVAKKVSISCSEHLINKLKISVTQTPISANLTLCVYMFHIVYIYIYRYTNFPVSILKTSHPLNLQRLVGLPASPLTMQHMLRPPTRAAHG